jgi:hypothetical protein
MAFGGVQRLRPGAEAASGGVKRLRAESVKIRACYR